VKNKKNTLFARSGEVFVAVLLGIICFSILVGVSPYFQPVPATDSSIFLYTGDQILNGQTPYRDVWDHKGPLIYYINALGLLSGSRWGVWILEFVFVLAAAWLLYRLLRSMFGSWPALFASVFFLVQLKPVLDRGNLVEEYGLFLQVACLWFLWKALNSDKWQIYFATGVIAALAFLLRPNIIGIPLAIGSFFVWRAFREKNVQAVKSFGAMVFGGGIVLLATALYFLSQGALADLWDAVFVFNFAYSGQGDQSAFSILLQGLRNLSILAPVAIAAWILLITWLRSNAKDKTALHFFLTVLALVPIFEFSLTAASGRSFPHYFLSWLPVLAALCAFFIYFLGSNLKSSFSKELNRVFAPALLVAFAVSFGLPLLPALYSDFSSFVTDETRFSLNLSGNRYEPVLGYLNTNADPDQKLLMFGNAVAVNWLSGRRSPSRFVYQSPLLNSDYATEESVQQVIDELVSDPPIIIDTNPNGEFLPAIETRFDRVPIQLRPLYHFINEHYVYAGTFQPLNWDLYLFQGQGVFLDNANAE
jgi:hypothetical protein